MLPIVKSPNFNYFELKNWAAENKCWRACDVNTRTLITYCVPQYSYSCCRAQRAVQPHLTLSHDSNAQNIFCVGVVQSGKGVAALMTLHVIQKKTQVKAKIKTFLQNVPITFFRPEGSTKTRCFELSMSFLRNSCEQCMAMRPLLPGCRPSLRVPGWRHWPLYWPACPQGGAVRGGRPIVNTADTGHVLPHPCPTSPPSSSDRQSQAAYSALTG